VWTELDRLTHALGQAPQKVAASLLVFSALKWSSWSVGLVASTVGASGGIVEGGIASAFACWAVYGWLALWCTRKEVLRTGRSGRYFGILLPLAPFIPRTLRSMARAAGMKPEGPVLILLLLPALDLALIGNLFARVP
jgi:hypothetical protein